MPLRSARRYRVEEKGIAFKRRDVDLKSKPGWLARSPLGKTAVLQVSDDAIYRSAVICEYRDETHEPRLHLESTLERARYRSSMEFGSIALSANGAFYNHGCQAWPAGLDPLRRVTEVSGAAGAVHS